VRRFSARDAAWYVALAILTGLASPAGASDHHGPPFEALQPGEFVTQQLKVPVRVVLIGFGDEVDRSVIREWLPAVSRPSVRYPQFYGLNGRDLGLEYAFQYSVLRKGKRFEDDFFRYLSRIGAEGPRTVYQTFYNNQNTNVLDVPDKVLYIDAKKAEAWLASQDRCDENGYTIYFVNWYGRPDFRFHLFTKSDAADPDTGFAFGKLQSRGVVAWGGTSSRSWFYDFSAGPEWNSANYVVDSEDLDGDGNAEYRMPVIWEYSYSGYRAPELLSLDMGLLARFVGLNLLFTSSPLYDPLVTAPEPFGRKIADLTMLEDNPDPSQKGMSFIDPAFASSKLSAFEPYYRWRVPLRAVDPIDDGAKQTLATFTLTDVQPGCWESLGTPFGQPFCYFDEKRAAYVPEYGPRDYVAPVFNFNTTDDGMGAQFGLLGFADDNWVDGTQSFVFTFGAPAYRSFGYGFTSTVVHEVGHHIGLSHPHDGYDPEFGLDYGASGPFYFAWVGDESDTVMHYISLSNGFGVHNRDNMYRWETAGYLNRANALAGDILASPRAREVQAILRAADEHAARATHELRRWVYLDAVTSARWAYSLLTGAAEQIGVSSARLADARRALPGELIKKEGCRPRIAPDQEPQP
jgi:hypothetical protein